MSEPYENPKCRLWYRETKRQDRQSNTGRGETHFQATSKLECSTQANLSPVNTKNRTPPSDTFPLTPLHPTCHRGSTALPAFFCRTKAHATSLPRVYSLVADICTKPTVIHVLQPASVVRSKHSVSSYEYYQRWRTYKTVEVLEEEEEEKNRSLHR